LWQAKQCFLKIGAISLAKSTGASRFRSAGDGDRRGGLRLLGFLFLGPFHFGVVISADDDLRRSED
jgi:hypothetical protein